MISISSASLTALLANVRTDSHNADAYASANLFAKG